MGQGHGWTTRATLAGVWLLAAGCAIGPHTPTPGPSLTPTPEVPELRPNTGMVSTLAIDAPHLMDFTVDAAGNLYLAELDGIRRVGTDGSVRVLAPVASGANTEKVDADRTITEPRGIARDRQGVLYIVSYRRLYKLFPDGRLETVSTPDLDNAAGPVVDSRGNVFVVNRSRDTIAKIALDGTTTTFAGRWNPDAPMGLVGSGYQDGPGAQALFRMPSDLAIDAQDNLYVADSNNGAIRKIDPTGLVSTIAGQGEDRPLPPSPAPGQATPDLTPYVSGRVPVAAVAVNPGGSVYAAGTDNRIRAVNRQGEVFHVAGDGTRCPDLIGPATGGIISNNPDGQAASPTPVPSPPNCRLDGPGLTSRFKSPSAIAIDGYGRVYVLDGTMFGDRRIRKIE